MAWKQITEERYDEMLGVVPPAFQAISGFLVGEPTTARTCKIRGSEAYVYPAFAQRGGEFFENEEPMTIAEMRRFIVNQEPLQ